MRWLTCLAVAASLTLTAAPAWAEPPPEPNGYRLDDYKAPTPKTLHGASILTTAEAEALWKAKDTIFIDVLSHPPKSAALPAGTIWRDPPHDTIPGAVWLPEVGRGELAPVMEEYFKHSLADLTKGDADKPLVIFCRKNCWMSWNAAKRALSYGYHRIYWYSDGVDGWKAAALPLEATAPRP